MSIALVTKAEYKIRYEDNILSGLCEALVYFCFSGESEQQKQVYNALHKILQ